MISVRTVLAPLFIACLALACSDPPAAPPRAPAAASACAPQQFAKSVASCCGLPQWYWDGAKCADATTLPGKCGCTCDGPDCGKLFNDAASCEAAHQACAKKP